MNILLLVFLVLIVLALLLWGVEKLSPPIDGLIVRLLQVLLIVGAAFFIASRAGLV